MYENVLVPFDFSTDSRYAVQCLKQIPDLRQVILLHVVYTKYPPPPGGMVDPAVDYARLRLEEFRRTIEWEGIRIGTRIEAISGGDISDVVNRVAAEEGTSLVVMGRRGMGVIEALLLGSVASDVLRHGDRDLLLVHAPAVTDAGSETHTSVCSDLFSHILVCTDFSEPDIVTLCREELSFASRMTLLHVVTTGDSEEAVHLHSSDAWTRLKELRGTISPLGIPVRATVCEGDAADEIIRHSHENGISLIVMKSAGRRGFIRNFLGSTTAYVSRNADEPILVMKRFRT
ncbi:MAG: universal stress protein [Methanolinea sp.]|jgi:nucleotide-binding universal stress UspA family protein|nr:universal stress protein [Methanolinea sp.]